MARIKPKQLEGVYGNQLLSNKLNGTVDPGISNDINQGYYPGSVWVNVVASPRRIYVCADNSPGAAIWLRVDNETTAGGVPVGTIIPWDKNLLGTPPLDSTWAENNGQLITDPSSPYNGSRIANLNGATITGIPILAIQDTTFKSVTVSASDGVIFNVGDTLTFSGATVPNAVVRLKSGGNGIYVGDFTLWNPSAGSFQVTTSSLLGATSVTVVGTNRFLRGASISGGSDVNQFQGHWHSAFGGLQVTAGSSARVATNNPTDGSLASDTVRNPTSDGVNGTPRTGSKTQPDYYDVVFIQKIKP